MKSGFDIIVSKSDFKFNCAHFIAHTGFRERLHGHNYQLKIQVSGNDELCEDGYLIDFGDLKKIARQLCKDMNEHFIVPMLSDVVSVYEKEDTNQLCLACEDGSKFQFPKQDCIQLPLVHSSAEELAHYFWYKIIEHMTFEYLITKGIYSMEVTIAEAPNQEAVFRSSIPTNESEFEAIKQTRVKSRRSCFTSE